MAKPKHGKFRWALDSSVIIALIKGNEEIHGKPAGVYSRALFDRADAGEAILLVSGIALVEVCKPHPRAAPFSPPNNLITIEEFFSKSYVEIIEVGRECGRLSRAIAREEGLPPWDAVHVASAILGEAELLFCWDRDDLLSRGKIRGLELREPPASILPSRSVSSMQQSALIDVTKHQEPDD